MCVITLYDFAIFENCEMYEKQSMRFKIIPFLAKFKITQNNTF